MNRTFKITVKRQDSASDKPYLQTFAYSCDGRISVADLLRELNAQERIADIGGHEVSPIVWECACFQKKCGACAMRINGHPALACSVFLGDAADRRGEILLEPLGKFPVVRDLKVDRSMIPERLKEMHVWLTEKKMFESEQSPDLQFQAARCMLCGICLEVCPTFGSDPDFAGAASMVKMGKTIGQNRDDAHLQEMRREYRKHFYNHCCQSLSCVKACPLHLPLAELQAAANRQAVWRKK